MKLIRESEVAGVRMAAPHARTLKHLVAPWTLGSQNLWVGMTKIDPNSSSNPHRHPRQEEVFYVVSGRGSISVGGELAAIEPGVLVLVPLDAEHQLVNDGDETLKVLSAVSPPFAQEEFDEQHQTQAGRS